MHSFIKNTTLFYNNGCFVIVCFSKNMFVDVFEDHSSENYCAVMSSKLKYGWKSYLCESGLPFVCKKYLNKTEHETLGKSFSINVSFL